MSQLGRTRVANQARLCPRSASRVSSPSACLHFCRGAIQSEMPHPLGDVGSRVDVPKSARRFLRGRCHENLHMWVEAVPQVEPLVRVERVAEQAADDAEHLVRHPQLRLARAGAHATTVRAYRALNSLFLISGEFPLIFWRIPIEFRCRARLAKWAAR